MPPGIIPIDHLSLLAYHTNTSGDLVLHEKITDESGNTIEMKIWRVPLSAHIPHGYKYSLVYIVNGERVIGYDNAERKGDHRHWAGEESDFEFKGLRQLTRDFLSDVERYKENHHEG